IETLIHGASGANVIVDLLVSGAAAADRKALIREIQRDPVVGNILHLDLQHISLTERITVEVPIELIGTPTGVKDGGGILEHLLREVEIECLPTDIPTHLEADVSLLNIGDSLHVSDLKAERVTILTQADRAIATVVPPTVLEEVAPAEAAVAEPELVTDKKEGEEGEEEEEGKAEGGKKG
ncbi:MAG TPA: 50S ribosomal protein L25, partial [Candidatus Limnocylindrales bacterium]|nr:50S ribosomal protein L25 [Candidatus Limnocylindrales bacterium]